MSVFLLLAKKVGALGEPPPRRLTRKLLAPFGGLAPRGRRLDAAALAAHFAFGAAMGGVWGVLPAKVRTAKGGLLFGLAVWAANYAGLLPAIGLMPPPSKDRAARPTSMVLAHLIFGAALYEGSRSSGAGSLVETPYANLPRLRGPRAALLTDFQDEVQALQPTDA